MGHSQVWLPMMSAVSCIDVPYNCANSSRMNIYVMLRIEAALMACVILESFVFILVNAYIHLEIIGA